MGETDWFPEQPDDSENIWRYLTLPKFISILDNSELWFSNATKFDDPYEGSTPRTNVERRVAEEIPDPEDADEQDINDLFEGAMQDTLSRMDVKWKSYLNCWHLNPHESMAMWDRYSDKGRGIAIRSNVGAFIESVERFDIQREPDSDLGLEDAMKVGKVRYIDYVREGMEESTPIAPFFHKRSGYRSEQEFRTLFVTPKNQKCVVDSHSDLSHGHREVPAGFPVAVDLETLIDSVYVDPDSSDLFSRSVKTTLEEFGPDMKMHPSNLDSDPIH